jgi:hypothetical protein
MTQTDDLEQRRQEIIAHIKQVFPKNPRVKGKLRITQHSSSERNELREMLEGKQWIDIIGHPSIIYNFTDVDYLFTITDEAYLYYLPAFLTATMYQQGDLYTLANEKIRGLIPKFSFEQIETLIAYFEYQIQFLHNIGYSIQDRFESIEDVLLRLMIRRDELAAGGK